MVALSTPCYLGVVKLHELDPNAAASPEGGIFGLPFPARECHVVLLPVPWDVTTSYRPGAAKGPSAIVRASHQIDLYDTETGRPYRVGIAMLDEDPEVVRWNARARALAEPIIEAGGAEGSAELSKVNALSAKLNGWVRARADEWLDRGRLVGVVGGDHSSPFGLIEAIAARHPGVGILHVDAHADLRAAYEGFTWSHASIMHNVMERLDGVSKLVQVGVRDLCEEEVERAETSAGRIVTHRDTTLAKRRLSGETWAAQCAAIVDGLPDEVYVSFDIDGLDPALCPHTGTPVPGGLSFIQASMLLEAVAVTGRRIVGFDLNEVAPGPDGDEWDANVGARVLYRMIGWALRSRGEI
jgi:agmatinase